MKMMKYVLLIVAMFAVFTQSVPAPGLDDGFRYPIYGYLRSPYFQRSFYIPEPICSYKCPIKCYNMGLGEGSCTNSICSCLGYGGY